MHAAHFAAGLAIKAAQPKAPTSAVMAAVFLPDFLWLGLSLAGVEPVGEAFFDGWSHSIVSIACQALLMGLVFSRWSRGVSVAAAGATLSHIALDMPIHPRPLELYPHSAIAIGSFFRNWGVQPGWLGRSHHWWVEAGVTLALLALYAVLARRAGFRTHLIAASALLVCGIQLAFG
jgi:hypothetical protein